MSVYVEILSLHCSEYSVSQGFLKLLALYGVIEGFVVTTGTQQLFKIFSLRLKVS